MNEMLALFCDECSTSMPTIQIINKMGDSKMIYNKVCQPCLQVRKHMDDLYDIDIMSSRKDKCGQE